MGFNSAFKGLIYIRKYVHVWAVLVIDFMILTKVNSVVQFYV